MKCISVVEKRDQFNLFNVTCFQEVIWIDNLVTDSRQTSFRTWPSCLYQHKSSFTVVSLCNWLYLWCSSVCLACSNPYSWDWSLLIGCLESGCPQCPRTAHYCIGEAWSSCFISIAQLKTTHVNQCALPTTKTTNNKTKNN